MVRLRRIKKYGGSRVISLTPGDLKDKKWEIGDMVDIDELKTIKKLKGGSENGKEEKET